VQREKQNVSLGVALQLLALGKNDGKVWSGSKVFIRIIFPSANVVLLKYTH
jgi:hypothetical protein